MVNYFFKNPLIRFLFHLIDLLSISSKKEGGIVPLDSILLSHPAHLGDVLLMSSLLPILKKNNPKLKIGVLVSRASAVVFKDHPLVDAIHCVDHWKTNRGPQSFLKKFWLYLQDRKKIMREIRNYQASLDCNFHFPNFSFLAYRSKIPVRIGYKTAGFSHYLTHAVDFKEKKQSAAVYYFDLLKILTPNILGELKPHLPCYKKPSSFPSKEYLIVHMGSGDEKKKWGKEKWKTLIELINFKGPILLTGLGSKEEKENAFLIKDDFPIFNLANQLDWLEYVSLIQNAQYYLGVDSCGGHVASSSDTPSLLIYSNNCSLWKPLSPQSLVLVQPTVEQAYQGWQQLLVS